MARERDSEGRSEEARLSRAERSLLSRVNNIVRMTDLMAVLMVVATAMSAFATWRSARISNLLFLVSERPYIGVESVSMEPPRGGAARIVIEFRNFGYIPASNTVIQSRVTIDGKEAGNGDVRGRVVNAGVISPTVPHRVFVYLADETYNAISATAAEVIVSVRATYHGPEGHLFCYRERYAFDRRSGWFGAAGGSDDCNTDEQ